MPEDTGMYDHEIITRTGDFSNITTHFFGTPEAAVDLSEKVKRLVADGTGISDNDFRAVVDTLVSGEPVLGGIELWEKMNKYQQAVCQEIKKSVKRLNYKRNS